MNFKLAIFRFLRKMTLGMREFSEKHGFLKTYVSVYECFRKPIYDFFRPQGTVKFKAKGFYFYVSGEDYVVASHLMTYGCWEKTETEIIESKLSQGMIVLDVGANFGYFSLIAARCVGPHGHVYAFEPEPKNFELLCKNIAANKLTNVITPIPMALSKESGELALYLSSVNYGAHSLGKENVELGAAGHIKVKTSAMDSYLKQEAIQRVDFIKTDTQGAEPWIFQGAQETLKNNGPLSLLIEFWPAGMRRLGAAPESFLQLLVDNGLAISVLEDEQLSAKENFQEIIEIADRHSYVTLLLEKKGSENQK